MDKKIYLPKNVEDVLKKLNIQNPDLLGKGGEGWIFAFENKALKVYIDNINLTYLQSIESFQKKLSKYNFSFDVPRIYEIGKTGNTFYTIEKRLSGLQMDKKIPFLNSEKRQHLYKNYYGAIKQINSIEYPDLPYGQVISAPNSITSESWTDYLIKKFKYKVMKTRDRVSGQIKNYDEKVIYFERIIKTELQSQNKNLVHCDYYLNNVLVGDDLSISAVLDFSVHLAVGDPRIDVSSVLTWNEIDKNVKQSDYDFLYDIAEADYGKDIRKYADLYFIYSSFYYADMDNPSFSIKNLNNNKIWNKYGLEMT